MQKAKVGKRIGAFFIDGLILGLVVSLITTLFEDPAYLKAIADLDALLQSGAIDFIEYSTRLENIVDPNLGIKVLVELLLTVVYFIIIPIFWKEQTLARKWMKIKVVKEDFSPAKPVNFILREGLGQAIFASVFTVLASFTYADILIKLDSIVTTIVGFVLLIGFFTMCGSKKTTLYDRFSKTLMVSAEDTLKADELDITDKKENTISNDDIIDL